MGIFHHMTCPPNQNPSSRFSSNNRINLFMASDHLGCCLIRNTGRLFSNLLSGSLSSSDVAFGVIRLRYHFGYLFFLRKACRAFASYHKHFSKIKKI